MVATKQQQVFGIVELRRKGEIITPRDDNHIGRFHINQHDLVVRALVFAELKVEIDAWARLDVDLREAQTMPSIQVVMAPGA